MHWWVWDLWQHNPVMLMAWVFWIIASIVLHELGHGFAAIRLGDSTPRDTGHMTLNPLVHMGPTSLMLFAVFGIAWGAMPVDPARLRGRYAEALVAAAGPAVNLLLAALSFTLFFLWVAIGGGFWIKGVQAPDPLFGNTQTFFLTGMIVNIALMLFNLIPVPPLDGSRILGCIHRPYERLWMGPQAQYFALIAFVVVFFLAGDWMWAAGLSAAVEAREWTRSVLSP